MERVFLLGNGTVISGKEVKDGEVPSYVFASQPNLSKGIWLKDAEISGMKVSYFFVPLDSVIGEGFKENKLPPSGFMVESM